MKYENVNWSELVNFLKRQIGKPYIFGVENDPKESNWNNYQAWDCSEIVEVGFAKIGIGVPDGSYNQDKVCSRVNGEHQVGDLAFKWDPDTEIIHHVGIYIGNDMIVEAKGKRWGVVATPVSVYESSPHFAHWGRLRILEAA